MMLTLSALFLTLAPTQGRQIVEPAAQAPAQEPLGQILMVHDVHDVISKTMTPPAVSKALRESDLDDVLVADVEKLIADRTARDQFVQLIRTWVPIESEAQLTVTSEGMLIANMTPASHAELSRFIDVQRSGPPTYQVDLKLVEVPKNSIPADLIALPWPSLLNDEQTRIYRQEVATDPLGEELQTFGLNWFSRQEFSISNTQQLDFISDVLVHRDEASGAQIEDPVVVSLEEGVTFRGRQVPLAGDRVGFELNVKIAKITRPIPTLEFTPEFATKPVRIQLPESVIHRAKTEISLDSPGAFVLLLPSESKNSRPVLVDGIDGSFVDGVVRRRFLEGVIRPSNLAPPSTALPPAAPEAR